MAILNFKLNYKVLLLTTVAFVSGSAVAQTPPPQNPVAVPGSLPPIGDKDLPMADIPVPDFKDFEEKMAAGNANNASENAVGSNLQPPLDLGTPLMEPVAPTEGGVSNPTPPQPLQDAAVSASAPLSTDSPPVATPSAEAMPGTVNNESEPQPEPYSAEEEKKKSYAKLKKYLAEFISSAQKNIDTKKSDVIAENPPANAVAVQSVPAHPAVDGGAQPVPEMSKKEASPVMPAGVPAPLVVVDAPIKEPVVAAAAVPAPASATAPAIVAPAPVLDAATSGPSVPVASAVEVKDPEVKAVEPTPKPEAVPAVVVPSAPTKLEEAYKAAQVGQIAAAIILYKEVLQQDPDNKNALFGLATSYHKNNQTDQAKVIYIKILGKYPDSKESLNNFLLLVSNDPPQSTLVELEKIEELNKNSDQLQSQIAMLHMKLGNHDNAIKHFNSAIALAPDNVSYKYNLAVLYDNLGRDALAASLYHQIVEFANGGGKFAGSIEDVRKRMIYLDNKIERAKP